MSEPIYVENVSNLQFHRIIQRDAGGYADLLPEEMGKIPPEIAAQPRIRNWIESGRLKVISQEEFQKHFTRAMPSKNIALTHKTKAIPEKQEDTSAVVLVPGIDELPETEEIPSPEVTNLDSTNGVTVRAPADNNPLIDESDSTETPEQIDLRPKVLHSDGTLSVMNETKNEQPDSESSDSESSDSLIGEVLTPSADIEQNQIEDAPIVSGSTEIEVLPSNIEQQTASSAETQAESIIALGAWRKQQKALKDVTDPTVLQAVCDKTTLPVIKRFCEEKLNS